MKTKRSQMRNKRRRIRERKRKEERRLDRIAARTEQLLTRPVLRTASVLNVGDNVMVKVPSSITLAEGVVQQRDLGNHTYEIALREAGVVVRRREEIVAIVQAIATYPKVQTY